MFPLPPRGDIGKDQPTEEGSILGRGLMRDGRYLALCHARLCVFHIMFTPIGVQNNWLASV